MTLAGDGVEEGQVQERTLVQPLRTRPPGEETSQREDGQIAEVIGLSSELGICWVASRTWLEVGNVWSTALCSRTYGPGDRR